MEFIPKIDDPAHPRLEVPNFREAQKAYKPGGLKAFVFYPHYEGYNIQHLIEGNFDGKTWRDAAGFIQRWAYWGMIFEILHIGGLRLLDSAAIADDHNAVTSFSEFLPTHLYTWQYMQTDPENSNAEQIESDRYADIILILMNVNALYTRLVYQEFRSLEKFNREKKAEEKQAEQRRCIHVYEKHTHPFHIDNCNDHDGYVDGWVPNDTFYNGELHPDGHILDSPGHALILSIGIAGELLAQATERRFRRGIPDFKWPLPLTLLRRLQLAGWCPVWLRKLRNEGSVARAYYLSSIPREPKDKHAHCCSFGCIANQVQSQKFQVKHVTSNCDCEMVHFDLGDDSQYASWIREGDYPLIVRTLDETSGEVKWDLVRSHNIGSSEVQKYVAMSHVWADETGSVSGNCLLACQLENFSNGAAKLYMNGGHEKKSPTNNDEAASRESIPFWVDTICVPFHQGLLKMLAIQKMEQIYRGADKVLVYDKGVQQFDLQKPSNECLTQIEISAWNERLWTIQEAAFAKGLYFQFKGGITSIQDLQTRYRSERFATYGKLRAVLGEDGPPLMRITLDLLLSQLNDEEVLSKPPNDFDLRGFELDRIFLGTSKTFSSFIYTLRLPIDGSRSAQVKWNFLDTVLPYRQTSVVADEGLCLSTLLGLNLTTLYSLPEEEWIRRMFLKVGTINAGILFGNRPRFERSGYRWMPSTFVAQRLELSKKTASVTEAGVTLSLPGLLVKVPPKGPIQTMNMDKSKEPFGFLELTEESDDDGGPRHLVAVSFPMTIEGTGRVFIVNMHLPKGAPAIKVYGSASKIVLEQDLMGEDPSVMKETLSDSILQDWKYLHRKRLVEAFLVQEDRQNGQADRYSVTATIHELSDPTPFQLLASAVATPLGKLNGLFHSHGIDEAEMTFKNPKMSAGAETCSFYHYDVEGSRLPLLLVFEVDGSIQFVCECKLCLRGRS